MYMYLNLNNHWCSFVWSKKKGRGKWKTWKWCSTMPVSLTMLISLIECVLAQAASFTMHYFYCSTYSNINDAVISLGDNSSITVYTQYTWWWKYRQFLINISRFEDILDLKYMVIYFNIIKHMIYMNYIHLP